MPLVSMKELLDEACQHNYGIPAINVSNMETITGLLEVATRLDKAVIIQVAPIQLKIQQITYRQFVSLVKVFLSGLKIKVALHLDHATTIEECLDAIDAGFTSVMFDGSLGDYRDNVETTKRLVDYARPNGVTVEAELGKVGGTEGEADSLDEGHLTDPNRVKDFIESTGVDCLAVAIGNAHGDYKGSALLDFKRLCEINEIANIPLVLHGGTGIDKTDIQKSIGMGIKKINVFTEIDRCFVKGFVDSYLENPKVYMMKAQEDARQRMMQEIESKFKICYMIS